MKTLRYSESTPMLNNAVEFWKESVKPPNRRHWAVDFWEWMDREYAILRKPNQDQLIFRDEKLSALFFLRFSS